MSSTKRGGQRSPADNYPTPNWCLHRFLDVFIARYPVALDNGLWLEPGAGEGNLVRAINEWFPVHSASRLNLMEPIAPPLIDACELREECVPFLEAQGVRNISIGDYFTNGPPTDEAYDMIITNPPFSIAMEFIFRSLEANTRFVAMLQRLNFIGSEKRHSFMKRFPPSVYVLPNRPSFKADGSTDSIEYAWYVWDKHTLGAPGDFTLLELTPKEERKAEHARIKASEIFPVVEEEDEEDDG